MAVSMIVATSSVGDFMIWPRIEQDDFVNVKIDRSIAVDSTK